MYYSRGLAVIVLLAAVASAREDEKPRPDTELIQGKWKIISFEADGQKETGLVGDIWEFTGDKIITDKREKTYRLDPAKRPGRFDAQGKPVQEGFPPVGMVGIYKLEGDTLTICFGKKEKPKEFESRTGSEFTLYVCERARPL